MPDFRLEEAAFARGATTIAGVDEAGRGPLAGPVVAAAVVLSAAAADALGAAGLDDSKRVTPRDRGQLFGATYELATQGYAMIGIGAASTGDILARNILHASMLAMSRAVAALPACPDLVLVDGNRTPDLPCAAEAIIKGDGRSLSIAAASIVAKVIRDRAMTALARRYPGYGWERNAGYGTRQHLTALHQHGPTPHHRRGFAPVAQLTLNIESIR